MTDPPRRTTDELVEIVRRLQVAAGTDDEIDELMAILLRELPDPGISDLIFYTSPPLTAEEVVAKALAYRPIEL